MFNQSIAFDLMATMDALHATEEKLEISIIVVSVLVVLGRIVSLATGPRNGLFATVNVFIFAVFLGCCGFLVADEHHMTMVATTLLDRIPGFSN